MINLDTKDYQILEHLQENGRMQLTDLAKKIKLSIDATHKRLKKMQEAEVFKPGIFINPYALGYGLIANIQIKLQNINEEELNKMIGFLKQQKQVIEIISILGDYDMTCVIIAKNTDELNEISTQIRQKFKQMIADWHSVINMKIHKFEEYHF